MNILKPIALTLMTALILTSSSTPKDKEDHSLVALWKEYYAAQSADKPKTQEDILEKIKAEAKAKHLTWDFYDAAVRLAARLRGEGKSVDLALHAMKPKKFFAHAGSSMAAEAVFLGPDDVEKGAARLKNLETREEAEISL